MSWFLEKVVEVHILHVMTWYFEVYDIEKKPRLPVCSLAYSM